MINDLISDMINRIKIFYSLNLNYVFIIYSKMIISILCILKFEGYLDNYYLLSVDSKNIILIRLKYYNNKPVIQLIKRLSKPSLRIYKKYKNLPIIMNGLGLLILSTNKGVMSNKLARLYGIGGELICYVF